MTGTVYFIGAGPGDPGLLTLKGKEILERAGLIVYAGSLVNREILSFAGKDARVIDSAPLALGEITGEMISAAKNGMTVARVHSGDPSVYGAIAEQMKMLEEENILYEIIPGVTSVTSPTSPRSTISSKPSSGNFLMVFFFALISPPSFPLNPTAFPP